MQVKTAKQVGITRGVIAGSTPFLIERLRTMARRHFSYEEFADVGKLGISPEAVAQQQSYLWREFWHLMPVAHDTTARDIVNLKGQLELTVVVTDGGDRQRDVNTTRKWLEHVEIGSINVVAVQPGEKHQNYDILVGDMVQDLEAFLREGNGRTAFMLKRGWSVPANKAIDPKITVGEWREIASALRTISHS